MNYRPLRVGNLIRDELSAIILRELEFPGALVTITAVAIDQKLEMAKVKVSILPGDKAETALTELESQAGRLQHELSHKLNIRPMPRIRFELDHGPEKAADIEKILMTE